MKIPRFIHKKYSVFTLKNFDAYQHLLISNGNGIIGIFIVLLILYDR